MQLLWIKFISELLRYLWKDDTFLNKTYCIFWLNEWDAKEFTEWAKLDDSINSIAKGKFDSQENKKVKKNIIDFYASKWILFCPYCWLNQYQKVSKINSIEVQSFELDHFIDKWRYPQYACSLYNLIPVCMYCNQRIKHINSITHPKFNWKWFFHIIYWWLNRNYFEKKFEIANNKNFDELINTDYASDYHNFLKFNTNEKKIEDWHIYFFRLNNIYQNSPIVKNEINYIWDKIQIIQNNLDNIKSIKLNPIDLFFWHYPNIQNDMLRQVAWKIKKDIISEISQSINY